MFLLLISQNCSVLKIGQQSLQTDRSKCLHAKPIISTTFQSVVHALLKLRADGYIFCSNGGSQYLTILLRFFPPGFVTNPYNTVIGVFSARSSVPAYYCTCCNVHNVYCQHVQTRF